MENKKRDIFKKRVNYKPFEYPEVMDLVKVINQTYWKVDEVDFTADIQDFKSNLTDLEKEIFKRNLLAISQVEVGVKTFWGKLYDYFPKPEFNNLGATFAENECTHSESYSKLLEVLGYNDEFEKLLEIPIFKKKIDLIDESLTSRKDILERLMFFTIVIENASLFSQFANILSFTRFKGIMKNTANIINWSSSDEQCHAEGGIYIINTIKEENPDYFKEMSSHIIEDVHKYIQYEKELLDWIFEKGELEFYTKNDLWNFMKYRVDLALERMGFEKQFNVTEKEYKPMRWYDEETKMQALPDFFAIRPVEYTKHNQPYTKDNLF